MKCMIGCMLQSFINNDRAVTLLLVCGVSNFLIVSGYKWSERTTRNYERLEEEAIYPPIKFMDEHKRVAEVVSTFNSFSPELGEIPLDIVQCYVNSSLWDAVQRMPFSIQTLSSIVRKLEGHSASASTWSAGRMAANIIHRFRFDGIQYDRCADTTTGALPLKLDVEVEYPKMRLIWQLVQGYRDQISDDALTDVDKCVLHWMVSYSVNKTLRFDEIDYFSNNRYRGPKDDNGGTVNSFSLEENDYDAYHDYRMDPGRQYGEAKVLPDPNEYDFWDRPFFYNCDRNLPERK